MKIDYYFEDEETNEPRITTGYVLKEDIVGFIIPVDDEENEYVNLEHKYIGKVTVKRNKQLEKFLIKKFRDDDAL